MKHIFTLVSLISFGAMAQVPENFIVEIEPLTITNAPGVHSYSFGVTDDNKWVVLGGRVDGLHQRQPFAAFLEQDNNKSVYVIDPINEQVWSSDLSVLSASLFEQLQSTNQNFQQRDTMLYIVGGYGYSATAVDHITFPNLTAISINELADAVIAGSSILPFFRQITDVTVFISKLIVTLESESRLVFNKTGEPEEVKRSFKVTLGIMPDYLFTGKGLMISGVKEHRPGAVGGLLKGDVIVKMGSADIDSMIDYMEALNMFNPGEKIKVVVERSGKKTTIKITF